MRCFGGTVECGVKKPLVRRHYYKEREGNNSEDQDRADKPYNSPAPEPLGNAGYRASQRESGLHYCCPPITRTKHRCGYFRPAFHSCRMFCEIDIDCGATEEH